MCPAEIIKEFRINIDGLEHSVKGRIVKSIKGDSSEIYLGELSHYCKPSEEAATIYQPSLVSKSYENVEYQLLNYLEKFTLINVTNNPSY